MAKEENEEGLNTLATTTRSVVESYIFATGHQDLSIYSERLMMLLVRAAQCQVAGLNFRDGSAIRQVSIGPLGDASVEIEARELLSSQSSTNYTNAKNAVRELMNKTVSHERPAFKNGQPVLDASGRQVYEFEAHQLVNDIWVNRKPGVIIVNVNKNTWEAILDFSKGFRRYDLQVAMKFSRTCSLRMFKLISNQTEPIQYTIAELREQWGLKDKYAKTKDFIRNTIVSAKEELDRMSPWTFDWEPAYSTSAEQNRGRTGRKSITSIIFFPKHQLRYESTTNMMNRAGVSVDVLGRAVIDRLVKNLGFTMSEIKSNLVLFDTARKNFDLEEFLISITPSAGRANSPQGYVVNAVKKHLKEACGIVVSKTGIVKPSRPAQMQEQPRTRRTKASEQTVSSILSGGAAQRPASPRSAADEPATVGSLFGGIFEEPDEQ